MKKIRITMRNIFFIKSLIKHLLLLMIPFIAIFSYSLYRSNMEIRQTMKARNWNLMYQLQTQVDSFFHTVNIVTDFITSSPSANNVIVNAFQDDKLNDSTIEQMSNLSRYLQSIINSNNYSHSCYLYFDNDLGRYISTANGLSYVKIFSNENWMTDYLNTEKELWCLKEKINLYSSSSTTDVIAIYKKIYSPYTSAVKKGILITYFSSDILAQYVNNFDLYPEQSLLLYQEDGTMLFQNTKEDFKDLWPYISDQIDANNQYINISAKYQQRDYTISVIKSSEYDLYCVSMIPTDNIYAQAQSITFLFIVISIASLFISIIMSLISAKHDYTQLQTIIEKFNNTSTNIKDNGISLSKSIDPYQVILDNVINLFIEQHNLQMKVINNQYQMELLELKALQHQINPHFVFNTLNTIYWESIRFTDAPNTCSQMISDLSDIMAYSLGDINAKEPIHNELKYLLHYTNIQSIRYKNKIKIVWDVDNAVSDYLIIKMALQPFLENSIYHGLKEKKGPGIIKIKIQKHPDNIFIKIMDNGLGITGADLDKIRSKLKSDDYYTSHIGIFNTNRRLTLTYGKSSSIRIKSWRGKGTIVSFTIPIEKSDEFSV